MHELTDEELKTLAESECVKRFGAEDWNSMFSGDQEAYIETWIDGYRFAKSEQQPLSGMPEVSEAEVALLKDIANGYAGDAACPLCHQMEDPFDHEPIFKDALPYLLKRKDNV